MASPNADHVRHVVIRHAYPVMFHEALKVQAEEGFALARLVPFTDYEFVAVFEKASPNDSSVAR